MTFQQLLCRLVTAQLDGNCTILAEKRVQVTVFSRDAQDVFCESSVVIFAWLGIKPDWARTEGDASEN